jgi:hypothetical protein
MEDALVAPSAGLSTDGSVPNGEMVRVIDTGSGTQCFEWCEKEKLLPPFVDHVDRAHTALEALPGAQTESRNISA